jgi:tetratricopeptide (TPR) repeat protein
LLEDGTAILKQIGDSLGTTLSLHTLGRTYHALGYLSKAERAYQECLELGRSNELPLGEALALNDLGNLNYQQGIFEKAKAHYRASLKIYRDIGDRRGRALALNNLGLVDTALGDYDEAEQQFQESLTICEQTQNRRGLALTLNYLSNLGRIQQAFNQAQALNEESLSLCRDIGYAKGIAQALQTSGDLALDLADYSAAERLYQESLDIYQDIGFQDGEIDCRIGLGRVARWRNEPQKARPYFSQALSDASALQTMPKALDALVHLADLLLLEGQADQALEIVVLAERQSACTKQTQENAAQLLAELITKLPPEVVAEARADGSQKAVDDLIEEYVGQT